MKYTKPTMNISLFEAENVVTTSGLKTNEDMASNAADAAVKAAVGSGNQAVKLTVTF